MTIRCCEGSVLILPPGLISNLTRLRTGAVAKAQPKIRRLSHIDTTHPFSLFHMFRLLIRTPARSFQVLSAQPFRSFSISAAFKFNSSLNMADSSSAQSTPVESSASTTPAPPNANAPAQQKQQKQQNNKKQNRPPHPNAIAAAANAKPKPVKKEVRILMLHGRFTDGT